MITIEQNIYVEEFGKSKGEEHEVMVCLVYRNDDVCEFNKKRRRKYK